ncbi:tlde1 domain-containing protein [Microvirga sp. G4-2]|uniref:tlde1 domain-containing protein n=1 Tax=Microvirga sp. G4-2 TaxID=3434467 RepID=UPI0040448887
MMHYRYPSGRRVHRKNRRNLFLTAALVAISMSPVVFYANLQGLSATPPIIEVSGSIADAVPAPRTIATAPVEADAWMLVDPKPMGKPEALGSTHNPPLGTTFKPPFAPRAVASAVPPMQETVREIEAPPASTTAEVIQPAPVPLPVPRPAEFRFAKAPDTPKPEASRSATAADPARVKTAALQTPQPAAIAEPSFIEKLFGIKPAAPPDNTLSYAALGSTTGSIAPSARFSPAPQVGDQTAVYDISAKVVIMPNGERLEAHSGLGDKLDDPRFVHVRMRGATPPGTYLLTEREALFHGVRALRMNPVGGSAAIHGRDGILAHTYMLGPNGDSNGCVSFRDYDRFLQAYLRGEVKRLVVVAGSKQDLLPRMVSRS